MDRGERSQRLTDTPALRDPRLESVEHRVVRHGPVRSLEEAAKERGITPAQVVKTMVVRRSDGDYLFVLVPGDRTISWPKLRRYLGVNRVSMPDASEARSATGYEPGTITPLGSARSWPVIADATLEGEISLGGGARGVSIAVDAGQLIRVLQADTADVTE